MTSPEDPFRTPPPGGSSEPASTPAPYGAPPSGYGAPAAGPLPYGTPPPVRRNGLGTASLVLGIVGIVTFFLYVGGLLGIVAIVLGVIGRGRAKRGEATNGGVALAGILTGVAALLIGIAVVAGTIALFQSGEFGSFRECVEAADSQAEVDRCSADFEDSVSR